MNAKITRFAPRSKTGILLVSVLLLVIFMFQVILLVGWLIADLANPIALISGYLTSAYATLMYLVISLLIVLERRDLREFNIDKFALVTLILGSLIRRRFGIPGEGLFIVLIWLAGISLIATWVLKKPNIPRTNTKWVLNGIAVGVFAIVLFYLLELVFREPWTVLPLFRNNLAATAISEIVKELSFGALLEEFLFRGFLWGYLRKDGWSEKKIAWTQGLLFWFLHIGRIITPFTFFIAIPIITIILTKLTIQSKQLYPAIVCHIVINVLSSMLNLSTY